MHGHNSPNRKLLKGAKYKMKLFGSKSSGARLAKNRVPGASYTTTGTTAIAAAAAPRKRNRLKPLAFVLAAVLFCELCYFFVIYTDNGFISKWRSIYIETAMDTLDHKWLATAIIPSDIIAEVMDARAMTLSQQENLESSWDHPTEDEDPEVTEQTQIDMTVVEAVDPEVKAKEDFDKYFHEVDPVSLQAYLDEHPEALENGWANLKINEAGLDDSGTSINTIHGDQILAIDMPNKILLVRVKGNGFQGVLALAKDPAQLYVRPSSQLWTIGETVAQIASANNGVLAMTGSAFIDPDGGGNGGELAGYAMYDGVGDGYGHMGRGYKRLEIHEDNLMYIKDAPTEVGAGTTDAVEFGPALVVDGNVVVDANCGYTGIHPRAAIGQSKKYEVMMLIIEGRLPLRSMGTNVIVCAEILEKYGCMQAMNLDGGTSAIMWYDGETITACSNQALPDGRPLPTAFVYERIE